MNDYKHTDNNNLDNLLNNIIKPIENPRFEQTDRQYPPRTPQWIRDQLSNKRKNIYG